MITLTRTITKPLKLEELSATLQSIESTLYQLVPEQRQITVTLEDHEGSVGDYREPGSPGWLTITATVNE